MAVVSVLRYVHAKPLKGRELLGLNKEKIKSLLKGYLLKIYLPVNAGTLLMGIFSIFIGVYPPICGANQNDYFVNTGCILIAFWFVFLPCIDRSTKDKIIFKAVFNLIALVIALLISCLEYNFIIKTNSNKILDMVLLSIGGVFVFSYIVYFFSEVTKALFILINKIDKHIFPKLGNETSGLKRIISSITAVLVSITAFLSSLIGFISILRK